MQTIMTPFRHLPASFDVLLQGTVSATKNYCQHSDRSLTA